MTSIPRHYQKAMIERKRKRTSTKQRRKRMRTQNSCDVRKSNENKEEQTSCKTNVGYLRVDPKLNYARARHASTKRKSLTFQTVRVKGRGRACAMGIVFWRLRRCARLLGRRYGMDTRPLWMMTERLSTHPLYQVRR